LTPHSYRNWIAMLGILEDSPCSPVAPVYVVRNTFVELVDENNGEPAVQEVSVPPFRRRRGSSFFRSASEPHLTGGGRRSVRSEKKEGVRCEDTSTEDEGSVGVSTPGMSPATSRDSSPEPGSRSPMYAGVPQCPESTGQGQTELSAAMHAGFNAGLFTAMAMKAQQQQPQQPQQQMPVRPVPFCSQGVQMGQLPFFYQPCNQPFAFPMQPEQQSLPRPGLSSLLLQSSSTGHHSSNSSDAGTVLSGSKQPCHLIWCDHRAFKDTACTLKAQLETGTGASVKTHKTAENCIRLFRKKQRAQGRPPCIILVSWANAAALLAYLADADHVSAKVIVLCDARSCRSSDKADELAAQFPFIEKVASTWDEAVESACNAVAAFK